MDNRREYNISGFSAFLLHQLKGRQIVILGYGREGRSSFNFLSSLLPKGHIGIADQINKIPQEEIPSDVRLHFGATYMEDLEDYDTVLVAPGIPHEVMMRLPKHIRITSQSDLFLQYFAPICIGITGTKGKSTTSVLVRDMLIKSGKRAILAGNIGLPLFEAVTEIVGGDDCVVLELSAHQLRHIHRAPHIACILNLFEEHLDHFESRSSYYWAKWNIALLQGKDDQIFLNTSNEEIISLLKNHPIQSSYLQIPHLDKESSRADSLFPIGKSPDLSYIDFNTSKAFPGRHQKVNATVAAMLALAGGANPEGVQSAIDQFKGLPHRLEYVGCFNGITYYNDAIATIPEAVIEALRSIKNVDVLLLGGLDRGISYAALLDFLRTRAPLRIFTSGPAGKRIYDLISGSGYQGRSVYCKSFKDALSQAIDSCKSGETVLLSPAAPSYDEFGDFTEKGDFFKKKAGYHS